MGAFLRTFVTLRAPGHTDRAAAGIHTVLPWDRSPAALVLMGEVTLLRTQVWKSQVHILYMYIYIYTHTQYMVNMLWEYEDRAF